MITRLAPVLCCILIWTNAALTEELVLSTKGADLGRITASDISSPLNLTVALDKDQPTSTFVMARFQNNRPIQRRSDGQWIDWDGHRESLLDNSFIPAEDGTLTFALTSIDLTTQFLPVVFTIAYETENGLKTGHLVVDQ